MYKTVATAHHRHNCVPTVFRLYRMMTEILFQIEHHETFNRNAFSNNVIPSDRGTCADTALGLTTNSGKIISGQPFATTITTTISIPLTQPRLLRAYYIICTYCRYTIHGILYNRNVRNGKSI